MRSWIIAFAVTGLFLQPVLTLGAALPLYDFGTLTGFLIINGLLIFGLVTGVTLLVGMASDRRGRPSQSWLRAPHPASPRQFADATRPEQQTAG